MDEIDLELANRRARRDACRAQLARLVLDRDGEIARLGGKARGLAELRADAESRASSLNAELDKLGRERRAVMTCTPELAVSDRRRDELEALQAETAGLEQEIRNWAPSAELTEVLAQAHRSGQSLGQLNALIEDRRRQASTIQSEIDAARRRLQHVSWWEHCLAPGLAAVWIGSALMEATQGWLLSPGRPAGSLREDLIRRGLRR
jgi:DNA repair exonuclease SbcCD ATPase subunit